MQEVHLAALLASRLCHDLTGPVGAISNGVELLMEETDEDMRRQSLELVEMSAGEANRRLIFFRLAIGAAGGLQAAISLSDARRVALDFFEGRKMDLEWPETLGTGLQLSSAAVRLLLNLLLLAAESLPRGGRVTALIDGTGPWTAGARADGAGAFLREADQAVLNGTLAEEELDARTAQPAYAAAIAASIGSTIKHASTEDSLMLSVEVPEEQ